MDRRWIDEMLDVERQGYNRQGPDIKAVSQRIRTAIFSSVLWQACRLPAPCLHRSRCRHL